MNLQHRSQSREFSSKHIKGFNFKLTSTILRKIYCPDRVQQQQHNELNQTSLDYSRSFAYTNFNNTLATLCLVPYQKQQKQCDISTDASSTVKIKKTIFRNKKEHIRRIIQKHNTIVLNLQKPQLIKQLTKIRSFNFRVGKKKLLDCTRC